jgi:hypothetical protein
VKAVRADIAAQPSPPDLRCFIDAAHWLRALKRPWAAKPEGWSAMIPHSGLLQAYTIQPGGHMANSTGHHLPTLRGLAAVSALMAGLVLCTPGPLWAANQPRQQARKPLPSSRSPLNPKQIFQRVSPFLLTILTYDSDGQPVSQGSAFLIEPTIAVTNLHVMKYAKTAVAKSLNEGLTYSIFGVQAFSRRRDVCLLILATSACHSTQSTVSGPACGLPLRPSTSLAIGDDIYVAGTPQGLEGTFSKGMITAIRGEPRRLQIDAPVSPGSSGGPVLNAEGMVVGVVVSTVLGGQNLNFAVPIEEVTSLHELSIPVSFAGGIAVYDRESQGLHETVRSVKQWGRQFTFQRQSGRYFEEPAKVETLTSYDRSGNETRMDVKTLNTGAVVSVCHVFDTDDFLVGMGCGDSPATIEQKDAVLRMARPFGMEVPLLPAGSGVSWVGRMSARGLVEMVIVDTPGYFQKTLSRFDGQRREQEQREFGRNGELRYVKNFTYQDDSNGNWVVQDVTTYSPEYSDVGFTPWSRTYREVSYYED